MYMDNDFLSNKNIKEKQILKTSSLFSLFAFALALALIAGPFLSNSSDQNREKSILKAQSLAYQVVEIEAKKEAQSTENNRQLAALSGSKDRSPASLSGTDVLQETKIEESGLLGSDPWGQPYHYKIRVEKNQKVVDVWSVGENAIQTQVLIPQDTH